jgi:hypothetical protein
MEALEKLFGSSARVKILRLFLMNPNEILEKSKVVKMAKVASTTATKEVNMLEKIDFLKQKSFFKERKYKNGKTKKVREKGYVLNRENKLYKPLELLLVSNSQITNNSLTKKITKHGKISVILLSGLFIQDPDSRVDLLVVGDSIKERQLKNTISSIEAEIGKTIRYAMFETEDFKYRMGIYDRLVRDILDYPHEIVLDKIGL